MYRYRTPYCRVQIFMLGIKEFFCFSKSKILFLRHVWSRKMIRNRTFATWRILKFSSTYYSYQISCDRYCVYTRNLVDLWIRPLKHRAGADLTWPETGWLRDFRNQSRPKNVAAPHLSIWFRHYKVPVPVKSNFISF